MADLLQSQIRESCRLAIPEGLKELMSDISREVLRAQPQNLYQFIADYLSALLVSREHLFIASRVCDDVCKNRCCQELEDELCKLSLTEEDVQECLKIVARHFSSGAVNEGNLLQKLMRKTDIGQETLQVVQAAVRRAFLRHQVNHTAPTESSSTDSELEETTLAARHTLKLYKEVTENHPDINYDCVASKIQAAYRAYNVQRKHARAHEAPSKRTDASEKVRFQVKPAPVEDLILSKRCASKCSSVSLAGSFISLPLYNPYSIGERSDIAEQDEVWEKEKENANFDYVTNVHSATPRECQEFHNAETHENKKEKKTTISFHTLPHIVEVDYNEVLDDAIEEDIDVLFEQSEEGITGNRISGDIDVDIIEDEMNTETPVLSEIKDESESSDSWVDEDVADNLVQQSEMQRLSKEWVDYDYDDDE